jgi:tRNA threonylcarbamoyladenosine biosynthesis protein TsaB
VRPEAGHTGQPGRPAFGPMLVLDTATPATVVGLRDADGTLHELRHDPAPGERPGHVRQLPGLALRVCREAGVALAELDRIGAGVGPGSFTGLRIGIATARSLAQATAVALVPIPTLAALAVVADPQHRTVLAVIDARRGEAFATVYRDGELLFGPVAAGAVQLAELAAGVCPEPPLAVGSGALVFRAALEAAGAIVPGDDSVQHRVSAAGLCALALAASPIDYNGLVPDYVRAPDAKPRDVVGPSS